MNWRVTWADGCRPSVSGQPSKLGFMLFIPCNLAIRNLTSDRTRTTQYGNTPSHRLLQLAKHVAATLFPAPNKQARHGRASPRPPPSSTSTAGTSSALRTGQLRLLPSLTASPVRAPSFLPPSPASSAYGCSRNGERHNVPRAV